MAVHHTISKVNSSPLTTGTLWTVTGGIKVITIFGIVRTVVQSQATTVKLTTTVDSLTAVDLSNATADLNAAAVGTVIQRTAAVAGTMTLHANGAALQLQLENTPVFIIPTTSAVIAVTYGAASTGAVTWYMTWEALVSGATVV